MKLSESQSIVLFRFHKDVEQAAESIRTLRHYNPDMPIHAFYGGPIDEEEAFKEQLADVVSSFYCYPHDKKASWKWKHTDLMLKDWYRNHGRSLEFDFVFSYEYDLLTVGSLYELFPDIDSDILALSACQDFTDEIEEKWSWTGREDNRPRFMEFQKHMQAEHGISRQKKVCLGPGPLIPRHFLDKWQHTEDVEFVNDEIAYPAYAEALGFNTVDHGMHPGFFKDPELTKYFNCNRGRDVTRDMLDEQLAKSDGRRSFHSVRFAISFENIEDMLSAGKSIG